MHSQPIIASVITMSTATRSVISAPVVVPNPAQLPPKRPLSFVPRPEPEFKACINVTVREGWAAWSLALVEGDGQTVESSGHLSGTPAQAVEIALAHLSRLSGGEPGRLYVEPSWTATASAALTEFEVRGLADAFDAHLVRAAGSALEREWAVALARMPRLDVAVDGSWSRYSRSGGWGVLGADGRHACGRLRKAASPLDGELRAIREALRAHGTERRLRILSDSRDAIELAQYPGRAPARLRKLATKVHAILETRDVELAWTKGHEGPGLHDGADRLAVLARRTHEAGFGPDHSAPIAAQIASESLLAAGLPQAGKAGHGLAA